MENTKRSNIDQYIAGFPAETQEVLEQVRSAIRSAAPEAEEIISYAMPTFKFMGRNLVHFAGYEKHIGLYPAPVAMEAFKKDLHAYKTGKGSVRFPLDKPMPLDLIARIVKFRIEENRIKKAGKKR